MANGNSKIGSKSGGKTPLVLKYPVIRVKEVRFEGGHDVWYARIPDHKTTYVKAPAGTEHAHLSPVECRPAAGTSHWKEADGGSQLEFSWPVAYSQDGIAGLPNPKLSATFAASNNYDGEALVKASSPSGIQVKEKKVKFSKGKVLNESFDIANLPKMVKWLSGALLEWSYKPLPHAQRYYRANESQHTFFIVGGKPEAMNLDFDDKILFEVIDWACRWADGCSGAKSIVEFIWKQFHPVRKDHSTKLEYWKNHDIGVKPNQDLVTAVQSQDDPDDKSRCAASCIVFDRVLLNCLAVHGIKSAEVKIVPPSAAFSRGLETYTSDSWNGTSIIAQGNSKAPSGWGSHWIADVLDQGDWKIYDPSYGAGPSDAAAPTAGAALDVLKYEPLAVTSFNCTRLAGGNAALKPDSDPAIPPHLRGLVLWTNK